MVLRRSTRVRKTPQKIEIAKPLVKKKPIKKTPTKEIKQVANSSRTFEYNPQRGAAPDDIALLIDNIHDFDTDRGGGNGISLKKLLRTARANPSDPGSEANIFGGLYQLLMDKSTDYFRDLDQSGGLRGVKAKDYVESLIDKLRSMLRRTVIGPEMVVQLQNTDRIKFTTRTDSKLSYFESIKMHMVWTRLFNNYLLPPSNNPVRLIPRQIDDVATTALLFGNMQHAIDQGDSMDYTSSFVYDRTIDVVTTPMQFVDSAVTTGGSNFDLIMKAKNPENVSRNLRRYTQLEFSLKPYDMNIKVSAYVRGSDKRPTISGRYAKYNASDIRDMVFCTTYDDDDNTNIFIIPKLGIYDVKTRIREKMFKEVLDTLTSGSIMCSDMVLRSVDAVKADFRRNRKLDYEPFFNSGLNISQLSTYYMRKSGGVLNANLLRFIFCCKTMGDLGQFLFSKEMCNDRGTEFRVMVHTKDVTAVGQALGYQCPLIFHYQGSLLMFASDPQKQLFKDDAWRTLDEPARNRFVNLMRYLDIGNGRTRVGRDILEALKNAATTTEGRTRSRTLVNVLSRILQVYGDKKKAYNNLSKLVGPLPEGCGEEMAKLAGLPNRPTRDETIAARTPLDMLPPKMLPPKKRRPF